MPLDNIPEFIYMSPAHFILRQMTRPRSWVLANAVFRIFAITRKLDKKSFASTKSKKGTRTCIGETGIMYTFQILLGELVLWCPKQLLVDNFSDTLLADMYWGVPNSWLIILTTLIFEQIKTFKANTMHTFLLSQWLHKWMASYILKIACYISNKHI